jgi:cobalt-zinc-cadmium efflux system membrane fusion protein
MFATVGFEGTPAPALVVPTTALFVGETASYVWVETSPWSFMRREVELGAQDRDTAVLAKGLASGERIVVKNGALLQ